MFGTASRYMRNGQFQPPGGPSTQMTPAGPGGYQPQGGGPPAGGGVAGGGMAGPAGTMGGAFAGGAGPGGGWSMAGAGVGSQGGPSPEEQAQIQVMGGGDPYSMMRGGGGMQGGADQAAVQQRFGGPVQAAPPQFGGGRTVGPGGQPMPPGGGPPSGPIMAAPPSFGPGISLGGPGGWNMATGRGGAQPQAPGGPTGSDFRGQIDGQVNGQNYSIDGQGNAVAATGAGYRVSDQGTQKALGAGGNLYDPTQGGRAAGGGGQFEKNDGMIQTAAGGLPPRLANAVSEGRMSLSQAAQRFGKFQDGTLGQGGQAPGQTEPAIGQGGPPPPGQGGPNPGVRPMGPGAPPPIPEKKQKNPGMAKLEPGAYRPAGGGPAGGGVAGVGAGGGAGAAGAASGGMAGGSLGGNQDKSKITVQRPGAGKGPMPINKPRPGGLSRPGVQPGGGNPTNTMVPGPGGQAPPQTIGEIQAAMPKQPPTTATPDIGGGQQSPMAQALMKRRADMAAQRYQQM